jgi:hypothetical protein
MIRRSLYSEQGAVFGVALSVWVLVASILLWLVYSQSELLSVSGAIILQLVAIVLWLVLVVAGMTWVTYRRV